MGLEDIVPDDAASNTSSSSSKRSTDSSEQEKVKIGSEPNQKIFSQEKWEEVKQVITDNMEYTVNEVKHLPSSKRYELLHQAATWSEGDLTEEQEELKSETNCVVCGKDCTKSGVEIAGVYSCVSHPAAKVAKHHPDAKDYEELKQ